MEHNEGMFSGQITKGIKSRSTLVLKTINFVNQQLPAWRDDPDRPREQAENKLNLQLCKFLDSLARDIFPMVRFNHEEYQTGRRSVDVSASPAKKMIVGATTYTIYNPILVIEGKRLPAPSKDREKEYVTGTDKKSGGIQRFKLGFHGTKQDMAIIVGYVQKQSLRHWHKKINKWILELANGETTDTCVWGTNETLDQLNEYLETCSASCQSVHRRSGSELSAEIKIHHLWIVMNIQ